MRADHPFFKAARIASNHAIIVSSGQASASSSVHYVIETGELASGPTPEKTVALLTERCYTPGEVLEKIYEIHCEISELGGDLDAAENG